VTGEEARLRALLVAKNSKIKELEEALMNLAGEKGELHKVLKYFRDGEPDEEEMRKISGHVIEEESCRKSKSHKP
jgi:hypothetical protein